MNVLTKWRQTDGRTMVGSCTRVVHQDGKLKQLLTIRPSNHTASSGLWMRMAATSIRLLIACGRMRCRSIFQACTCRQSKWCDLPSQADPSSLCVGASPLHMLPTTYSYEGEQPRREQPARKVSSSKVRPRQHQYEQHCTVALAFQPL